ncbi:MAG: CHAT domain-containing protein [Bacteroidetes bacterium]|nr:CHAT domain-containing protein [Bacteroidota bacterium]
MNMESETRERRISITSHGGSIALTVVILFLNITAFTQVPYPKKTISTEADILQTETIADSLLLYAKYSEASHLYQKLISQTSNNPEKSHYIRALNRLTDVYIEIDSITSATRYNEMAKSAAEKFLPAHYPELAYAYKNQGEIFNRQGFGKLAFENLYKAMDIMLKGGHEDHPYLASIYSDIGYEYDVSWEFNQAIAYHLKALSIIRKHYPEDHPVTASFINHVGDCYYGNNDFKTANIWHKKSLGIFLKSFDKNHPATGENLMDIGKNYLFLRVQDSSDFYLQKALPVLMNFYSEHHRIVCHYYEVMGYYHYTFQKSPDYLLNMQKSLALLKQRDVFHHRKIAWIAGSIGNMFKYNFFLGGYTDPSLIDSAAWYNSKAIGALVPGYLGDPEFVNPSLKNIIDQKSLLNVLRDKCLIHKNYIEHTEASHEGIKALVNTASALVKLAGLILEERQSEESRAALLSEIYNNINIGITTAFDYYLETGVKSYLDTVFYFAEKNKSRLLASVLNREAAMHQSGMPDSLISKEKLINDKITLLENSLLKIRPSALPDQDDHTEKLQEELFNVKVEQFRLFQKLNTLYPGYFHTCFNKEPSGLPEIQQVLDENEALLSYSMINFDRGAIGRITCFAITRDTVLSFTTPADNNLDSTLKAFCAFSASNSNINPTAEQKEAFVVAGYRLYQKLLEPAKELIRNKSLIIIPDGHLYRLPFEILLTQSNEISPVNFQELPYLIREHSISYANSASLFFASRSVKREPDHRASLLALAPDFAPDLKKNDPLFAEGVGRGEDFSELKGAREEIGFIHKLGGGLALTGKDATEMAFRQMAPGFSVIHIATHGVVDDRYPMQSRLIFYPDTTEAEDGLLNVYELYGMKLNAELVVLSACNTGYGTMKKGEGVVSLARGFAYAGVPSMVMSLWKVSDRSTARLMKYFYTYLKDGYPKDKAMQLAKLKYLDQSDPFYSNPHFWAGFVQIGDTVPVKFESRSSLIIWLVLSAVVLSGSGFVFLKLKSSRKKRI